MTEAEIDRLLLKEHLWRGHDGKPARPPHDDARRKTVESVGLKVLLEMEPGDMAEHTPRAVLGLVATRFDYLVDHGTAEVYRRS